MDQNFRTAMDKFDTRFFERYAKISLEEILGEEYSGLLNADRPDLQSPDRKSMGIEVTRAMEESKKAATILLKEIAGASADADSVITDEDSDDFDKIIRYGYGYGLQKGKYTGTKEYDYWAMALPLRRIIESKVNKAVNGFYGDFDSLGLYIFCKDDLSEDSVMQTCMYVSEIQKAASGDDGDKKRRKGYDRLFLSENDSIYVCDLDSVKNGSVVCKRYPVSGERRRAFFTKSIYQNFRD